MSQVRPETLRGTYDPWSNPDRAWLREARRVVSPNCDDRPVGAQIELVVIHGISLPPGSYGGGHVEALFTNRLDAGIDAYFGRIANLRVSAHFYIDRRGALTQFVPCDRRAWHAGESWFRGRAGCNDFSIGIELEGTDHDPYSADQYLRLTAVLGLLMARWPAIAVDRIVGHSDIAPGRKTDPGPAFDWSRLRSGLRSHLGGDPLGS